MCMFPNSVSKKFALSAEKISYVRAGLNPLILESIVKDVKTYPAV